MEICWFAEADISGCAHVFVRVFNGSPWNDGWELETAVKRLTECYRAPGFHGVIAKEKSEAIGFALGAIEQWDRHQLFYLREMCVAPERQRHGIGTKLIEALERELTSKTVARFYLLTVRDGFAQAFYERCGFSNCSDMMMLGKRLLANPGEKN